MTNTEETEKRPLKKKIPWGFIEHHGGLTAISSFKERRERGFLGEFAIELLGKLGVSEETLKAIINEEDPVGALAKARSAPVPESITPKTGVAGDGCCTGNECGRLGCPNCQD